MMRKPREVVFVAALSLAVLCSPAPAQNMSLELGASLSALEAGIQVDYPREQGTLSLGGAATYEEDSHFMFSSRLTLGNTKPLAGLRSDMGFRLLWGKSEEEQGDARFGALCFLLTADYTAPVKLLEMPVFARVEASVAPMPLCFAEAEQFFSLEADIGLRLLNSGGVFLGYRHMGVVFEDDDHGELSKNDILLGYRLSF